MKRTLIVIIGTAAAITAIILGRICYFTFSGSASGTACPSTSMVSETVAEQEKATPESCIASTQVLLKELKPQWSDEARQSYVDAVRSAIMGVPNPAAVRLAYIQHGLPSLISEMPDQTPSTLMLRGLRAEVRWYTDTCLTRPVPPESERLANAERVRHQLGSLLRRIKAQVHEDRPEIPSSLLAVASHRTMIRCQELQFQELAPILKSPLSQKDADDIFASWADRTQVIRRQSTEGMSQPQTLHQVQVIYDTLVVSLFENANMPEDVRQCWHAPGKKQTPGQRPDMSQAALQAKMESMYATRPEVAERWSEVFELVFAIQSLHEMQQAD